MDIITQNLRCLACDSEHIHPALNLGSSPLANSYKDSAEQQDARYPLAVNLCHDCYHLQLSHTVDPEVIYKNYMYATGTNNTIQQYCKWLTQLLPQTHSTHRLQQNVNHGNSTHRLCTPRGKKNTAHYARKIRINQMFGFPSRLPGCL